MSCALDCTWPAMRAMRFMVRRERGKSMGKGWEQVHWSQGHPKVAKFSVQHDHKKVSLNRNQNKFTKNVVSRKTGFNIAHLCPKPKSECSRSTPAAGSATKATAGFSGAARKSRGNFGAKFSREKKTVFCRCNLMFNG